MSGVVGSTATAGRRPAVRPGSLRAWLRVALVTGGALLGLVAALAATALVIMRDRQHVIIDVYFAAITEADTGHIALLDAEASVRGYAVTGNPVSLEVLERITGESAANADTSGAETLLIAELDKDDPALVARQAAVEAVATWFSDFAQPLLDTVEAEGPGSVSDAEIAAGQEQFTQAEALVERYTDLLRAEWASAAAELRTWLEVMTGAFAVLALSVIVLGALLWVFVRRWVTDPLMELAADARRVAGGEVRHSVDETGPGEVGALARDVEHMRARLVVLLDEASDARAQIEASHLVLEEQTEELRRSNRDLEQFAYVASHDLQEPLRKVASFTQLLASRYGGQLDERADQYIGFAVDGAKRMQRLINDLLGFSRVGRIGSEVTDVDLDATLRRVLADLQPVIDETGAEVEVGDLPVVRGEKLLLAQLLANLVGNALKFRHPDRAPVVRVDARRVGDVWELVCQDNGIGIDPAYAERVFVIFQRLHAKDVYEGTGIGLALCKKIVEYHGGDIWVDTAVTEGAAVRWTLPADVATVPPVDGADAAYGGGEEDA